MIIRDEAIHSEETNVSRFLEQDAGRAEAAITVSRIPPARLRSVREGNNHGEEYMDRVPYISRTTIRNTL